MVEFRLHSMHGPTVYATNSLSELIPDFERLNTPASNAGVYRIFMTDEVGDYYIVRPASSGHKHGHHTFCSACHACGHTQRDWCKGACKYQSKDLAVK